MPVGAGFASRARGTPAANTVESAYDLEAFNLTVPAIHQLPIATSEVLLPLAYGACYIAMLLAGASMIFERRDFR